MEAKVSGTSTGGHGWGSQVETRSSPGFWGIAMSGWRVVSWMRTWAGSFAMASRAFGVWWTKSSSSDPKFPEQLPRNGLAVGVGQQQTPRAACGSRRHTGPARKTARCCTTTLTRTRPRCSDRTPVLHAGVRPRLRSTALLARWRRARE